MTATSAAAATAIAAVPGDATTPVANKLADLTSYFLIILMVIFLEKYLVTLTGYAAFNSLIPVAVLLFVLWLVRLFFEVQISIPGDLPKKISGKMTGRKAGRTES